MAVKCKVEAEDLALSEKLMETLLVTRDQLDKCIAVSSKYRICHDTSVTDKKDSSCLATLYFGRLWTGQMFATQYQSHY